MIKISLMQVPKSPDTEHDGRLINGQASHPVALALGAYNITNTTGLSLKLDLAVEKKCCRSATKEWPSVSGLGCNFATGTRKDRNPGSTKKQRVIVNSMKKRTFLKERTWLRALGNVLFGNCSPTGPR